MDSSNLIPIFVGSAITIVALLSFFINSFVSFIFVKGNLIGKAASSFYILSFLNILGKIVFSACYLFYLGPSSIVQDYLFPDGTNSIIYKFLGFLCHILWGQDMIMEVMIAVNRLLIIVFPKTQWIFTYHKTILIAFSSYAIGIACAIVGDFLLPCCPIYMNYKAYSQAFYVTSFNYSSFYVYLPLNALSSLIAGIAYLWLYIYVRSQRSSTTFIPKSLLEKRKSQELKYAIQFSFCTVWGVITWSGIRIFGMTISNSESPISSTVTFLVLIHITTNATVLLLLNSDIKSRITLLFFCQKTTSIHPTGTTGANTQ